jgi:hypothetical protein
MKSNSQHQKDAIATDQKFRDDDEHLHEIDKRHLKQSEQNPELIPTKASKRKKADAGAEAEGDGD